MAVFRVEKNKGYTVMSNYHLKDKTLTLKSKGLLSIILSLPEDWNYSTRGLAKICMEGVDCIGGCLRELEKAGYIIRNRLRDSKGRITDTEYVIHEQPVEKPDTDEPSLAKPDTASPYTGNPYMDNSDTVTPHMEKPSQYITKQVSNQKTNTYEPTIHQSITNGTTVKKPVDNSTDVIDRIDEITSYKELIMENIDYDILVDQYNRERVDEVVELMLETVLSGRDYIRVSSDNFPKEVVKSRLLKLNHMHIEYVFGCIDNNTTKVHNIKAYLLSALYNAPTTMDSYYRAEVNHDLYGGRI